MRESNIFATLYTEDFGLLYVSAQSIREQASKMKYHLHAGSLVEVDIVRGKELWKLTGIHEGVSSLRFVRSPWYSLVGKISSLVLRLCKGEESNSLLWGELDLLYVTISIEQTYDPLFEIIIISRILSSLGYWSGDELCVTTTTPYSQETLDFAGENKRMLIQKINQALIDSQL